MPGIADDWRYTAYGYLPSRYAVGATCKLSTRLPHRSAFIAIVVEGPTAVQNRRGYYKRIIFRASDVEAAPVTKPFIILPFLGVPRTSSSITSWERSPNRFVFLLGGDNLTAGVPGGFQWP